MRSTTERASTAAAAVATTTASTVAATATAAAAAMAALTATACGQAVDAGACGVGLTASATAVAARLISARGKLIGHQRVDVTGQLIAIATGATVTARCILAGRAVVASVVKTTFWTGSVIATAFKARCFTTELSVASELTATFVAALTPAATLRTTPA